MGELVSPHSTRSQQRIVRPTTGHQEQRVAVGTSPLPQEACSVWYPLDCAMHVRDDKPDSRNCHLRSSCSYAH